MTYVRHVVYGVVSVLMMNAAVGCATRHVAFEPAEVPTGSWEGMGTFMAWETSGTKGSEAEPSRRSQGKPDGYETTLEISETTVFDTRAVQIEVLSKRGRIFESEDTKTHLYVLLMPIETDAEGSMLYAVGDLHVNPGSPPDYTRREKEIRERMGIPSASCVRFDNTICLQVHYLLPSGEAGWVYKDTYLFAGDRVTKTGSYVSRRQEKDGGRPEIKTSQITWTERLKKRP